MSYPHTDLIRKSYRAGMAHRHVTAISGHHRIQASPGYRAAAEYVAGQLTGIPQVEVQIRKYPADGMAHFWTTPSFLEWACSSAMLWLLADESDAADLLCDFGALPTSLIQRSNPVEGDFEVVAPGGKGGSEPGDYEGLDVRGKVVLTDRQAAQVAAIAVRQLGASGVLFDGMAAGGRSELDLPDVRQYTSFWWAGRAAPDAWGFVLSPRQGRALRARLKEGRTVRVRAAVDSRFYAGTFEVVEAFLPAAQVAGNAPHPMALSGTPQEILLISHLCHPQPGAHDNASGAAALLEAAAALGRVVADGKLPPLRRGIRFLWVPEMTGTFAWLAEHEADMRRGRWIAGLNLDMVGADQAATGGIWELVGLPMAGASFADHLLSWLREPFLDGLRHRETGFSAGSDHYILSDPSVGIPTPMLIHWPDKFYHTSADTPDKVSPDSLARSGVLAACYAAWLATAGAAEAAWLGHRMVARFTAAAGKEAASVVEEVRAASSGDARAEKWTSYRKGSAFRAGRMSAALGDLVRLDPDLSLRLPALRARVAGVAAEEQAWAAEQLGGDLPGGPTAPRQSGEEDALRPRRMHPGPIDVGMALQAERPDLVPAHRELSQRAGQSFSDYAPILQYWADGQHTISEIAELAWLETGRAADDVPLAYFKMLAEAGLVAIERDRA